MLREETAMTNESIGKEFLFFSHEFLLQWQIYKCLRLFSTLELIVYSETEEGSALCCYDSLSLPPPLPISVCLKKRTQ